MHLRTMSLSSTGSQILKNNGGMLFLCLLFLLLGGMLLNDTMFYNPDSANYLAWARSLASLQGFKITFGPIPVHYVFNAPLYPLLLAPVSLVLPYSVIAAKAMTLAFGALTLMLIYSYMTSIAGKSAGLFSCLFLVINPLFLMYSTQVLSDVPFCACLVLFLVLAENIAAAEVVPGKLLAAFIGTTCAAMFLRDIGLVLMLGAIVFFVMRKKYRHAYVLAAVALSLYLLWVGRNELIAIRMEEAPWRNTRLLFEHAVTGGEGSLPEEFMARIRINGAFYGNLVGGLVFLPQYGGWMYDVVRDTDPFLSTMWNIVDYARLPIILFTLGLCGYGIVCLRRLKTLKLIILLLAFYVLAILVYPTFDVRYLFPILMLMVVFGGAAAGTIMSQWDSRTVSARRSILGACVVTVASILAAPNIAWTANFVATSHAYCRSPVELYSSLERRESYPGEFTKLFRPAAQWIVDRTDSASILMSKYQSVGLWSNGRKVVPASPFMSLDEFECSLRDNQVGYIVSLLETHALDEFAFHMVMSRRFRFEPVYRIGDVEILRVERRTGRAAKQEATTGLSGRSIAETGIQQVRDDFLSGLHLLKEGKNEAAYATFRRLRSGRRLEFVATYYAAIAAEFCMRLDESAQLFQQLRETPQAGTFLAQIGYHQSVLQLLRSASHESTATETSSLYHTVSLAYWQQGFRLQALDMLSRSLDADRTNFTSLVFGALYALQQGDTAAALAYCERAERVKPQDPLVASLRHILAATLPAAGQETAGYHLSIAREYAAMGLNELAIDEGLEALRANAEDEETLRILAGLYLGKRRYAPARRVLERLCAVDPNDPEARTTLTTVLQRW